MVIKGDDPRTARGQVTLWPTGCVRRMLYSKADVCVVDVLSRRVAGYACLLVALEFFTTAQSSQSRFVSTRHFDTQTLLAVSDEALSQHSYSV